jgi:predicted nucleic acid-binding protein
LAKEISYVLDSFALLGFLENEPFAPKIENILYQAKDDVHRLYLHSLHLGEVYYITLREKGRDLADLAYSRIKRFPIKFVEHINEDLLLSAATIKANYPISYADSFAAALAKINNAALLTGDPDFRKLEKDGILKVTWLV